MDKIKNSSVDLVIISKSKCLYCDMTLELLNDNNIDYIKFNIEVDLTKEELKEIKPINAKIYPFIFKNNIYIGGYKEIKQQIINND